MSSDADAGDFAVIDLGTNTFHLLIGRWRSGKLCVTYRERHFVKVAADGIDTIGEEPAERARAAVDQLRLALDAYAPVKSTAFGTAALRTASNGPALLADLSQRLGVEIQLIDGRREAELIAIGVQAANPPSDDYLIMDIGGGSVEFIRVTAGVLGFRESYPVGAQVLRQRFHRREPFRPRNADASVTTSTQEGMLFAHLDETLRAVREAAPRPLVLVGASGTFDVLAALYGTSVGHALTEVDPERVSALYEEAVGMTEAERLADDRLPADRADMIVVALALIEHFVRAFPGLRILACEYALKEGALAELSRD